MPSPAVSVLMTTFRHRRFVQESLDSLAAQTCRDFETIITDDASDDGTPEVIEAWLSRTRFPARYIRNPVNRGICINRNAALAVAQGRFVCSLSGDDAYHPARIERQLAALDAEPGSTAAVYSDAALMDADSRDLGCSYLEDKLPGEPPPEGELFRKLLLNDMFLPAPAVMVRRAALDAVGRYDESLFFEDLYMWLKLSHRFGFRFVPGCLVRYRVLPDSLSRSPATQSAMMESSFRVLSAWLGRCGDADDALRERLWHLAMKQLLHGDAQAAGRMMAVIARESARWRRRAAAHVASLPGGRAVVRGVAWTYRAARRDAAGARAGHRRRAVPSSVPAP